MRQGQGCWLLNDMLKVPTHALHVGHTNNVVLLYDLLNDSTFSFAFHAHSNTEKVHMTYTKNLCAFHHASADGAFRRWCAMLMAHDPE